MSAAARLALVDRVDAALDAVLADCVRQAGVKCGVVKVAIG